MYRGVLKKKYGKGVGDIFHSAPFYCSTYGDSHALFKLVLVVFLLLLPAGANLPHLPQPLSMVYLKKKPWF